MDLQRTTLPRNRRSSTPQRVFWSASLPKGRPASGGSTQGRHYGIRDQGDDDKLGREGEVVEGQDLPRPGRLGKTQRPDRGDHPSRAFRTCDGGVCLEDQRAYPLAEQRALLFHEI